MSKALSAVHSVTWDQEDTENDVLFGDMFESMMVNSIRDIKCDKTCILKIDLFIVISLLFIFSFSFRNTCLSLFNINNKAKLKPASLIPAIAYRRKRSVPILKKQKDASCSATGQMLPGLGWPVAFPLIKDNWINEREAVEPNDNTAIKCGLAKVARERRWTRLLPTISVSLATTTSRRDYFPLP